MQGSTLPPIFMLEDNLRVPSGVTYLLENRKMMLRLFPALFERNRMAPVEHYPDMLLDTLRAVAPYGVDNPTVVVMTPGMHNSAYFEHAFLAQQMGGALLLGKDLYVLDDTVCTRTTRGPQRLVVYRRIDDDYLALRASRPASTLGVPGLLGAVRAGRARRPDHASVGNRKHRLGRIAPAPQQPHVRTASGQVSGVGQAPLARLARRHARHHVPYCRPVRGRCPGE